MEGIWEAAKAGDLAEVERLVDQDPGLLNGKNRSGMTPLTCASQWGHVGVVRWLLRKGALVNVAG
jgi:ankyrin repeat protein